MLQRFDRSLVLLHSRVYPLDVRHYDPEVLTNAGLLLCKFLALYRLDGSNQLGTCHCCERLGIMNAVQYAIDRSQKNNRERVNRNKSVLAIDGFSACVPKHASQAECPCSRGPLPFFFVPFPSSLSHFLTSSPFTSPVLSTYTHTSVCLNVHMVTPG